MTGQLSGDFPTEKDIENYSQLRQELLAELRKGKVFLEQKCPGKVGLINQGATCYLNSLLQALYSLQPFRQHVLEYAGDGRVMTALQRLFASLSLSHDCAISTKELTSAFGWTNAEVFEQHDAQELLCILLDAMGQESSATESFVSSQFKGEVSDTLACPKCAYKKEVPAITHEVPLHIPEQSLCTLTELLQATSSQEVLEEDNSWECGGCSEKVAASKSVTYNKIPDTLVVHLKRIRYDTASNQRKKVNTPVLYPPTLTGASVAPSDTTSYTLRAVLMHSGTAHGGHYRAYITSNGEWYEYDDSTVEKLTAETTAKLFWYTTGSSSEFDASAVPEDGRRMSAYEGAYLLIYERDGQSAASDDASLLPSTLRDEIQEANAQLIKMRQAFAVHRLITEVTVHRIDTTGAEHDGESSVVLHVVATRPLSAVLEQAYHAMDKDAVIDAEKVALSNCRLRKYRAQSKALGETFGGREEMSLKSLGLHPTASLALEIKSDDATFAEFNPREMYVQLFRWNRDTSAVSAAMEHQILVPGEDAATVGALRETVATAYSVPAQRIVLIKTDGRAVVDDLNDDGKILKSDCGIVQGDDIVVDVLPEGADRSDASASTACDTLRTQRRNIKLQYNLLTADNAETSAMQYDQIIEVSLDCTVAELKAKLAPILGVHEDTFHCRRNAAAPQLKELSKTLDTLGFVDQSIVHVQMGKETAPGEHTLCCEVDITQDSENFMDNVEVSLVAIGNIVVKERSTVAHLKEQILNEWNSMVDERTRSLVPTPLSVHHIRIRDGKTGQPSGPLRDERILGRCLLGLCDGRKIIIQVLHVPEKIGPEHVCISVRVVSFLNKVVSRPIGLTLQKTTTNRELYRTFLERFPTLSEEPAEVADTSDADKAKDAELKASFPESRVLSVAKALSTGAILSLKAALKLKWNEDSVLKSPDVTIDKSPLLLRDGSVLVIRSEADFQRAREAAKARVAERPSSVQADSPARGRVRPSTRGRVRLASKEKAIKINAGDDAVPLPPKPSPEKGGIAGNFTDDCDRPMLDISAENGTATGSLPAAPVRVVKVLRSPRPGEEATA